MEKQIMAIFSLAIFFGFVGLALRAWRRRAISQSVQFSVPLEALDFFGELLAQAKAFYVATTLDVNHLERIRAYGLGVRGSAQIYVFSQGLLVVRTGERPLAIPREQLTQIEFNQVAIDKAVEPNGLVSVSWTQDGVRLATHFRIVEPANRLEISNTLRDLIKSNTKREVIQ